MVQRHLGSDQILRSGNRRHWRVMTWSKFRGHTRFLKFWSHIPTHTKTNFTKLQCKTFHIYNIVSTPLSGALIFGFDLFVGLAKTSTSGQYKNVYCLMYLSWEYAQCATNWLIFSYRMKESRSWQPTYGCVRYITIFFTAECTRSIQYVSAFVCNKVCERSLRRNGMTTGLGGTQKNMRASRSYESHPNTSGFLT